MSSFRITLASPPDRARLVAEVFYDSEQIAELNQENQMQPVLLELYPKPNGQPWSVDAEQFLVAVSDARAKLLGR